MYFCAALRLGQRSMPCRVSAAGAIQTRPLGGLLARRAAARRRWMSPLLEVHNLKKHFPIHKGVFSRVSGYVYAVDGVSFHIDRGESLGLGGESGCGRMNGGGTRLT